MTQEQIKVLNKTLETFSDLFQHAGMAHKVSEYQKVIDDTIKDLEQAHFCDEIVSNAKQIMESFIPIAQQSQEDWDRWINSNEEYQ